MARLSVPTDRKKPGVAFWTTVVLAVVLLGYPASFGPACWIDSRIGPLYVNRTSVYGPLMLLSERTPGALRLLAAYAAFGMKDGIRIHFWYGNRVVAV